MKVVTDFIFLGSKNTADSVYHEIKRHLLLGRKTLTNLDSVKAETSMPVRVRCTMLDAWDWCTGTAQRDGMGREEGGGFGMGNTCIPVADSF